MGLYWTLCFSLITWGIVGYISKYRRHLKEIVLLEILVDLKTHELAAHCLVSFD